MNIVAKLHDALNRLKGFDAGFTSSNKNQMIINYNGANYKVTLEYIGEGDLTIEHVNMLSKNDEG